MKTTGDKILDRTLDKIGGKGLFVKELDKALLEKRSDLSVHSLKDMPGALDPRFTLAAVLPREQAEDVLVEREDADAAHPVVATGSVRRAHLVKLLWPAARTVPVRGNVATRLRKLAESAEATSTLLARAGLNRLGYTSDTMEVCGRTLHLRPLPVEDFPPALGQGIIALETRADDAAATALVSAVNHVPTSRCMRAERRFLDLLNADCSVPVAGLATEDADGILTLRITYFTPQGRCIRLSHTASPADSPETLAQAVYAQLPR